MKNQKGNTLVVILIIVVIGLLFLLVRKEGEDRIIVPPQTQPAQTQTSSGKESAAIIAAGKANVSDLVDLSIIPGQSLSGSNDITGTVQGGYFFEGNILVNVVDKNKAVLRAGHGSATGDWMTSGPVAFSAIVDVSGLAQGFAYIAIQNDNASGESANDKIIYVPIVINND
jgi:hypothetical protein